MNNRDPRPLVVGLLVFVERLLCRGELYFADGPALLQAISAHIYVIQPPGYWLFNRIAGLFSNPLVAIRIMNIGFSVVGAIVFYYAARLFAGAHKAFIASLAYSAIFFAWFSGEVHSTNASQLLFPVLVFYLLLRYDSERKVWMLVAAGVSFALGAGFRPSDGAFLLPMVAYYTLTRLGWKQSIGFLAFCSVLCLVWLLPTVLAYRRTPGGIAGAVHYVPFILSIRSPLIEVNRYSIGMVVRFMLPFVFAFWPVLGAAVYHRWKERSDWRTRMLLIWILPGAVFFVLIHMGEAPYINYMTAAVLLISVTSMRMMVLTAVWNAAFFLFFAPIPSSQLAVNVLNAYLGQYTRVAIEQQWRPNLEEFKHKSTNY
jgi:4-amino-4-deoxy-L-arabinose transferase-like glycosyltransferase